MDTPLDPALAVEDYCYLTTTGRVTGNPHEVEIWFGAAPDCATIYILAGGRDRADFIRNARKTPAVRVRIGGRDMSGRARIIDPVADADEDALARRLLLEKYSPPRYTGGDLDGWGRDALPLAIDLQI
jgi:hypothetical protein